MSSRRRTKPPAAPSPRGAVHASVPVVVPEWVPSARATGGARPKPATAGDWRPIAQLKPDSGATRAHRFAAAWAWLIRAKRRARSSGAATELAASALGTLTHARAAIKVRN
jgi:hypothetical protein